MANKIFITGPHTYNKMTLAKKLLEINDNLSIGERFTNDSSYENSNNEDYIYYLSTQNIDLTYKNNFMLFVNTNNYVSTGVTMDNYYNNDIFVMEIEEFNNISDSIFKAETDDIIVVWVDTNYVKGDEYSQLDSDESLFLEQRLLNDNIKYLYFFNENTDDIVDIILKYLDGTEAEKNKILLENN